MGLLLASMGYLVAAPDYPGFGVSEIAHPYMHANSLVPSVVDLLRAARHHAGDKGISLDGTLYLTAYDRLYGWGRLDEIFQEPWASYLPGLFDGSMTWGAVVNALPGTFGQLLDAGFVAGVVNGTEPDVVAAFTENTLLDWSPAAPVHFFHGTDDEIVPFQNALTARSRLEAQGATGIEVTAIPGTDHETAGPQAVIGAIQWFESIRNGGTARS